MDEILKKNSNKKVYFGQCYYNGDKNNSFLLTFVFKYLATFDIFDGLDVDFFLLCDDDILFSVMCGIFMNLLIYSFSFLIKKNYAENSLSV